MNPNKADISRLEALPQDILEEIFAKVGATSAKDFHNCIFVCKKLGASATDKQVLKTLNLVPLVK
ncbi:putative F-box domain-containing protein [Arabidopsis thaliana]